MKNEQKLINEKALVNWDECMGEWKDINVEFVSHRLYHCSAHILESENFYILRSYETLVACFNKNTFELTDMLRYVYGYTATSAQHISKFRNWIRLVEHLSYCDIQELRYYYV